MTPLSSQRVRPKASPLVLRMDQAFLCQDVDERNLQPRPRCRNAPHPTTRKRPRETLQPFAPRTQTFGVSGCRRCLRRVANARKFYDYSGERGDYKYAAI